MLTLKKNIAGAVAVLVTLLASASPVIAVSSDRSVSDVHLFSDGSVVMEDGSMLNRTPNGVSATLQTKDLPAGNGVTMWWVIFNNPEECTAGVGGFRCGEGDLFNPDVDASVVYAAGKFIGNSGKATFSSYLLEGDVSGAYFGPGLVDSSVADIHLVVRDHGPLNPELASEMIHSFGANCTPGTDPFGVDPDGDYACVDLQFAVHEQL